MSDLEYCPECSTYLGSGPSTRTDCPACGADLAELAPFDEGDETSPDIGDDDESGDDSGDEPDEDSDEESGRAW